MEVYLVLNCASALHARTEKADAIQDAHRLIKKAYEDAWRHSGSKPFDTDLPEDPERCVAWWNAKVPVTWRFTIQAVPMIPQGVKGPTKVQHRRSLGE